MTDGIDNVEDALQEQAAAREEQEAIARGHALRNVIDLGFQVLQFLDSDLGKRLEHDARAERVALTEKYVLLDPEDPKDKVEMQAMRFRINVLNAWQEFFHSYVKAGEDAQTQFLELEQPD